MCMIYLYKCVECSNILEEFRRVSDGIPPTISCNCGNTAKRVYSVPELTIKQGYPYYNVSLGRMVDSKGQEDREFEKIGAVKI
jgi:putative FmdB family regulatory protein